MGTETCAFVCSHFMYLLSYGVKFKNFEEMAICIKNLPSLLDYHFLILLHESYVWLHRKVAWSREVKWRKLLQINAPALLPLLPPAIVPSEEPPSSPPLSSPSPSPSPSSTPSPSPAPSLSSPPAISSVSPPSLPSPAESPVIPVRNQKSSNRRLLLSSIIGSSLLLFFLVGGIYFCRTNKVAVVKPWRTGLSGQLQKAFVTGLFHNKSLSLF